MFAHLCLKAVRVLCLVYIFVLWYTLSFCLLTDAYGAGNDWWTLGSICKNAVNLYYIVSLICAFDAQGSQFNLAFLLYVLWKNLVVAIDRRAVYFLYLKKIYIFSLLFTLGLGMSEHMVSIHFGCCQLSPQWHWPAHHKWTDWVPIA